MKNLYLILTVIVLNSCRERELSVEFPYEGDRMVVYCLLNPTEVVSVRVSKTYPPTGKVVYDDIDEAEVLLYENDKLVERLAYTNKGIYQSSSHFKPKGGYVYSLKINAPTLPSITTTQEEVPTMPKIVSCEFDRKIESTMNKGKPARKLILKMKDDLNKVNFYSVRADGVWQNNKSGLSGFALDQASGSESPCYFMHWGSLILSDACFQNSIYELNRGYETDAFFNIDNTFKAKDLDRIVVQIRQLNKSYYEYCRTFYNAEDLEKAFIPPYPQYNNIIGGYGIFGACNEIEIAFAGK